MLKFTNTKYLNVFLISLSLIFFYLGFKNLVMIYSENQGNEILTREFDYVVENNILLENLNFKALSIVEPLNEGTHQIQDSIKPDWLILFATGASNCKNSLNEINDYIDLSHKYGDSYGTFTTLLLYHGSDSLSAVRYVKATDIDQLVEKHIYITPDKLESFFGLNISEEFLNENKMFLIDLNNAIAFHEYTMPQIMTTSLSVKEIAFKNAMLDYINKKME
jgi:hypothetical protein